MRRRRDRKQRTKQLQRPLRILFAIPCKAEQGDAFVSVLAVSVLVEILLNEWFHLSGRRCGVVHRLNVVVQRVLIVANRSCLLENFDGVGMLTKIPIVLGHRPQHFASFLAVFEQSRLQQLVTDDAGLRPLPDPSPLGIRPQTDVTSEFVLRQLVEHLFSQLRLLSHAGSSSL